jgi:hypothetical protein
LKGEDSEPELESKPSGWETYNSWEKTNVIGVKNTKKVINFILQNKLLKLIFLLIKILFIFQIIFINKISHNL